MYKRQLFAVFAIVLTTFMITTVFSLGINYMENMKLMQVRTAGTTANASLPMPTEKQEQQIKNLEYVKTVGTQYMGGSVAEKNDMCIRDSRLSTLHFLYVVYGLLYV